MIWWLSMQPIKDIIIWFDFGGVLSPPIIDIFDQYQKKTGITYLQLWSAMSHVGEELSMEPLAPIELALIKEEDWGRKIRVFLSESFPELSLERARFEQFGKQWFSGVKPNQVMIDTVKKLKKDQFKVGILTNNVVEWEPHWRAMVSLDDVVDYIIDSCKVGVRKPDSGIFKLAEAAAKKTPSQCILIDDVEENCQAARERGWRAIQFIDNKTTLKKLSNIL